jgi:hypothetical protein
MHIEIRKKAADLTLFIIRLCCPLYKSQNLVSSIDTPPRPLELLRPSQNGVL